MLAKVKGYAQSSPTQRAMARRAVARSEVNELEHINEAALGWASLMVTGTLIIAAVVLAFASESALAGSTRAIPLFVIVLIGVISAARLAIRRRRFWHLVRDNSCDESQARR